MPVCKLLAMLMCFGLFMSVAKGLAASEADALYAEKKYTEAIAKWQEQIKEAPSADLFENIGTAYSLQGDVPHAILNFEKGLRFCPDSKSIHAKLRILRDQIPDRVIPLEPFFLVTWYEHFITLMRPGYWVFFGLIFLAVFVLYRMSRGGLFPLRFHMKRMHQSSFIVLSGLMILSGLLSYRYIYRENEAVVMKECLLRQAADEQSPTLRTLYAGEKIRLLDRIGEWYYVSLANFDYGWLTPDCYEVIRIAEKSSP